MGAGFFNGIGEAARAAPELRPVLRRGGGRCTE
jgi:hypothetical protein